MTRPLIRNGFGLTVDDADREVRHRDRYGLVAGQRSCLSRVRIRCSTVFWASVHDARLAAGIPHHVSHILT